MRKILILLASLLLVNANILAQQADSAVIRLAWLTDTHVGSPTGYEDLRNVIVDIRSDQNFDFAIVSGDISETDTDSHLVQAKALLDSMDLPYVIIPGNHDTKWSNSGGARFEQLWGSDRFNLELGAYRFIGVHQGPILRMGDGYIDPVDIAWVDSILQALPDPRQQIFMVTHYPLDPSVDNWYALMDVIKPFNIQAILHGHGHANRIESLEGIPGVMSRSTLSRKTKFAGYTVVTLTPETADFFERIPDLDSLDLWYTLALCERNTLDSLRLPFPDYSENDTAAVTLTWQTACDAIITSNPAIQGNQVFVTTTSGKVIALGLDAGQVNWTWQGSGAIHATPAIQGHRLVFGSTSGAITCLSTHTGAMLWQTKTAGPILGSPLIDHRRLYIGSGDGTLRSLKLWNGKLLWANSQINGYIETRPVIVNKKIMFGAWDETFYALDLKRGSLVWKWSEGVSGTMYSPAACLPVSAHGKVFIVAPDRAMTAIDIQTGHTVWRKTGHKVREMIGISEAGETVFARTMQDTVLAIDSSTETFKLKWIVNAGFGYDFAPGPMLERNGQLFFGTKSGRVYCLDSSNGKTLWHYRVSDGLVNAVVPVNDHAAITTAADGKVSFLSY